MEHSSQRRAQLAQIIQETISGIDKADIKGLRKSLQEAYPFESTRDYTYQVWLKEIHRQLGFKLKRSRKHKDQLELFE